MEEKVWYQKEVRILQQRLLDKDKRISHLESIIQSMKDLLSTPDAPESQVEFGDVPVDSSTPLKSSSPILGGTARRVVKRLAYDAVPPAKAQLNVEVPPQDPDETFFVPTKRVKPDETGSKKNLLQDLNLDDFSFPSDSSSDKLCSSYERFPKWKELPSPSKLRGKKRMALLPGQTCRNCEGVLDDDLLQKVSRHRALHKRPPTPEGYWNMGMPSTQYIQERQGIL